MSNIRTNYEKWYEGDGYYWGTEPADFCDELMRLCPPSEGKKVLDIGCGEGKDAVYMAAKGYEVTAFDLTENGIRKTKRLAEEHGVKINAYVDDINTFDTDEQFDVIYSSGTVQYLFDENKAAFFEKIERITKKNGFVFFNVFVEKPFLELPPDWDKEEKREHAETMIFSSDVYQRIQSCLNGGRSLTHQDWTELTELVNGIYTGFTEKLYSLYRMSEQDYHVSLLIKVRIQPKDIALLTAHSKESVATTRSRLYSKVFGTKGSSKDWDDFILSL